MASSVRGILGIVSLILLAGSIVLTFFVVLSGFNGTTPLDKTYFLRVDTSSIPGARAISQWTYFYVCGEGNTNCGDAVPALPFGYAWVGNTEGVPDALLGKHGKGTTSTYFYYVWRFGWVFYLMGLVFNVLGFFVAVIAPFSRLASGLGSLVSVVALFFFAIGASLMTAEFVRARHDFKNAGMSAELGRYAFGFTWASVAALFVAVFLLSCGTCFGGSNSERTSSSGGLFRRQRSRRSTRGSFVGAESESQQRVKEEY